jgi:hypothetical protein
MPAEEMQELTPLSKPRLLAPMKSAAGPWNHVALIHPRGCQTVASRSQSPADEKFGSSGRITTTISTVTAGKIS